VVGNTLSAKSVVTDFFATSSSCKDKFSLVVDDIQDIWNDLGGDKVVGKYVVYCIVAANPAIEECKHYVKSWSFSFSDCDIMRCSYCDILYGSVMIMGVFEIF
jgi:hypothetical protein